MSVYLRLKVVLYKLFVFYIHELVYEGRHIWSIVGYKTIRQNIFTLTNSHYMYTLLLVLSCCRTGRSSKLYKFRSTAHWLPWWLSTAFLLWFICFHLLTDIWKITVFRSQFFLIIPYTLPQMKRNINFLIFYGDPGTGSVTQGHVHQGKWFFWQRRSTNLPWYLAQVGIFTLVVV